MPRATIAVLGSGSGIKSMTALFSDQDVCAAVEILAMAVTFGGGSGVGGAGAETGACRGGGWVVLDRPAVAR